MVKSDDIRELRETERREFARSSVERLQDQLALWRRNASYELTRGDLYQWGIRVSLHRHGEGRAEAAGPQAMSNMGKCQACGRPTRLELLDAKPDDPSKPESCDWTRLECIDCYGEGWLPLAEEHLTMLTPEQRAKVRL